MSRPCQREGTKGKLLCGLLNKDNDIYFTIVGREASINKDSYLHHPWISGKRGNILSSIRRYYKKRQTHSGSLSAFPLIESPIDANSRRFDQHDASNQRLNRPVTRQVSSLGITLAQKFTTTMDFGSRLKFLCISMSTPEICTPLYRDSLNVVKFFLALLC